jgi:tRNA A-37 threonylcarbamoyl transferase component Bud32
VTPERYARIKQLFHHAVDLDPTQRDQYLNDRCGSDPQLRSEVEALLRHDQSETIIRSSDSTLTNFTRRSIPVSSQRTMIRRLQHVGRLTKYLGPRGFLALGGLIACILLALLGYFGDRSLSHFQTELHRETLNEIVDSKVVALRIWLSDMEDKGESWARSKALRERITQLVVLADHANGVPDGFAQLPIQQEIQAEIAALSGHDEDYAIWDRRHFLIADAVTGDRIGRSATPWGSSVLTEVFAGNSQLFAFGIERSITPMDSATKVEPHLAIVTPVFNDDGEVIAALQIHDHDSRDEASKILRTLRLGGAAESYVFTADGVLLSASPDAHRLEELGIIPASPDASASSQIYLRDPGGDLTEGYQPEQPLSSLPLTKMVRLCVAGQDGDDMDGYRDYLGTKVAGAWRWLDDLEVGVATELHIGALSPSVRFLIWRAWAVFGLFAICLGVAVYSYYSVHRLRSAIGENQKLGQYNLEKQIGEGGMGRVYKAQHELLRRPTAIKLLRPELVDRESLARFQREAQLVSQLENFNTIRVFDYGVTPAGVFYLVMEYIDGLSLGELIDLAGPLPTERTVFLLKQICYSLREAHDAGVVHRDLKPGNVMVCERGGSFDVIKVLDFGLVKPIQTTESQQITATHLIAGTPAYMAPERLSDSETNDPRSDIYALGAVAFFMLTGHDAFKGRNLAELLLHVANTPPQPPSAATDNEVPRALDDLVYRCLSKDPRERPASAAAMLDELQQIESPGIWSQQQAESWWSQADRLRGSRDG